MSDLTIYAPASATNKSGVIVIRISGPDALKAIQELGSEPGKPRYAKYSKIFHPKSKMLIDEVISIFYPGPNSFTGEDVIELFIHGGRAVLKLTLDALSSIEGLRFAEPGEFSKRRFLNGKIDLTQAEALIDLIEAETVAQHQQALKQLSGSFREVGDRWHRVLLTNASLIEAYIDFPDEDLPQNIIDQVESNIALLTTEIETHLVDDQRGEKLREGLQIAIIGEPNVGKSSLLNKLAKRDIAIVSNIAGTTRDVIEVHLDINGYPVVLADTAGIRDTDDELESRGIERAISRAKEADFKILVLDATKASSNALIDSILDDNTLIVANKIDLNAYPQYVGKIPIIHISALNDIGIDQLLVHLNVMVEEYFINHTPPLITRQRHRELLQKAVQNLRHFTLNKEIELAAEDLRITMRYLGAITGRIDVEMILGEIFSNFCIGK